MMCWKGPPRPPCSAVTVHSTRRLPSQQRSLVAPEQQRRSSLRAASELSAEKGLMINLDNNYDFKLWTTISYLLNFQISSWSCWCSCWGQGQAGCSCGSCCCCRGGWGAKVPAAAAATAAVDTGCCSWVQLLDRTILRSSCAVTVHRYTKDIQLLELGQRDLYRWYTMDSIGTNGLNYVWIW